MITKLEDLKAKLEKDNREALNLMCANYNIWRLKDPIITLLALAYVNGALDRDKEIKQIYGGG